MKAPSKCHPDRPCRSRGLCNPCYQKAWRKGELDAHRRVRVTTAEFAPRYEALAGQGLIRKQIARRLGMRRGAVDVAVGRARRAGLLERVAA